MADDFERILRADDAAYDNTAANDDDDQARAA